MSNCVEKNNKPAYDQVMLDIAAYVLDYDITSVDAYETAKFCLMDSIGCAILALNFPDCVKLLGPIVPNADLAQGARVPGTQYELDPVQAAFNIGTMIRWLDFNDTWLAAEWGHPSDNIGAILAIADYCSRQGVAAGHPSLLMKDVLIAMIKAYEIQGCLALENSFNRVGLDHVVLVKLASAALVAKLLGADKDGILRTLSQVFIDGQSLRTYRHAPNAGSRKSWAAGDACARAVRLALITMRGEMGYPSALSSPKWGFYPVLFEGKAFQFQRPYGSYVMENVLFKLAYPAEFHAQTAVECAVKLHPQIENRLEQIQRIEIVTQESAIRIISKQGRLYSPADRDHCLQYMVAVALLMGDLKAEYYEDAFAKDPRIDALREKMQVSENPQFSKEYYDPKKRSIANSIKLIFKGNKESELVTIEYPLGHKRRRAEGMPVLKKKFMANMSTHFDAEQLQKILIAMEDTEVFSRMSVVDFMGLLAI